MAINRRTILKYLGLGGLSFLVPTKELHSDEHSNEHSKESAFFQPTETHYYNASLGRLIDFQVITQPEGSGTNISLIEDEFSGFRKLSRDFSEKNSAYVRYVNFPRQTTLTLIYELGSEVWVTYNYKYKFNGVLPTKPIKKDIIEARAFTKMPQNVPCEFIPELKLHDNVFKLVSIAFVDNNSNNSNIESSPGIHPVITDCLKTRRVKRA